MIESAPSDLRAVRLPLRFDPAGLQADQVAIGQDEWVRHFNTGYFEGDWSGVPLQSTAHAGTGSTIRPVPGAVDYEATRLLDLCPHLRSVLETLQTRLRSVRVLKLGAGAVIREHCDDGLGWNEGEVRLHVPIATNPRVEFYIENRRIVMNEGECWYLDLGRPHRVQNRGATDRLHLVIDCELNDWLRALIMSGEPVAGTENNFAMFRELVLRDVALQRELREVDTPENFMARTVALGRDRGFDFLPGDVEAELNAARRRWFERGIR